MNTQTNKKKEIPFNLVPFEKEMTFDDNCWIAINTISQETTEVIYFNNEQKAGTDSEDIESFESFSEVVFEMHFSLNSNEAQIETDVNSIKSTQSGCIVKEIEDYDEETGKCWTEKIAQAQIIDVYKNKNLDDIKMLVQQAKIDLDNLEANTIEEALETEAYQKDPYAYYGVSRSDFF